MNQTIMDLDVDEVELDLGNPRIANTLQNYKKITPEAVAMALQDTSNTSGSNTTLDALKESIRENQGIVNPIIVNHHDGKYTVIEGNTRLQIYKDFKRNSVKGDWSKIQAIVYEDMDSLTINSIRLETHMVGPRPWNPYSKAMYLKRLRDEENLSTDTIVGLCGGNKTEIRDLIQAFDDMNTYYKEKIDPDDFDPQDFSFFRELNQSKKRIDALVSNGYTKGDFGKWVIDGKLGRAENVRRLAEVLNDDKARSIFINGDLKTAIGALHTSDQKDFANISMNSSVMVNYLNAITEKIGSMPFTECVEIKDGHNDELYNALSNLRDIINEVLTVTGHDDS